MAVHKSQPIFSSRVTVKGTNKRAEQRTRDLAKPSYKWIALPDIFRGVGINRPAAGNTSLLLWLTLGYMVVTAVLVVITWQEGVPAVLWLIVMRVLQGIGLAMLMNNSNAIITDAFGVDQRGLALGLNQVTGIAGFFSAAGPSPLATQPACSPPLVVAGSCSF